MSRLFYNRNHTFSKLFSFFGHYFQDASTPTAENLFLMVISMLPWIPSVPYGLHGCILFQSLQVSP